MHGYKFFIYFRLGFHKLNNESVKIPDLKIGKIKPTSIWKDRLENLRTQKQNVTVPFQTWQAKTLLSESKLLPQLPYVSHTYHFDNATQQTIETEFLKYFNQLVDR